MSNPRPTWVRAGRYLWVALALVALALLGISSSLSAQAVDDAETAARQRAERAVATVLSSELSPQMASEVIVGADRRDLLDLVRAQILSDVRVARLRIWRPDGRLIFSSAPGDDGAGIVAGHHLQFDEAAGGVTAVAVDEATGSTDLLLQTFVPMWVPGATAPYAVVQIDQRYGAIRAEANRTWRPVQIGLVVALAAAGFLFLLSFVGGRAARPVGARAEGPVGEPNAVGPVGEPSAVPDDRTMPADNGAVASFEGRPERDEQSVHSVRVAEERASAAERRARRAEERRAEAERRLREITTTLIPPDLLAQIGELDDSLKNEVAERERAAGEAHLLRSALEATEAELALARDGASSIEAEKARAAELVQEANQRAAEAEGRAEKAELRVTEANRRGRAAKRVTETKRRPGDAEMRVTEAKRRAREAEMRLTEAKRRAREAERRAREAERRAAEAEGRAEEAEQRVTEAERRAEEAEKHVTNGADRLADSEARVSELERSLGPSEERAVRPGRPPVRAARHEESNAADDLRVAQADTNRWKQKVAELEASLAEARASLAGHGHTAPGNGVARLEIELLRDERDVATADLRRARDELQAMRARIAELESLRKNKIS